MFKWLTSLFSSKVELTDTPVTEVKPAPKKEEPKKIAIKKADLAKMTKIKLEEFAKENYGVDIDRRKTKDLLVKEVFALSKKS